MIENIEEYQDYKTLLTDLLEVTPEKKRGLKAKLSEAMGVQSAYLSQVLNAHAHLSLEQAEKAAHFFNLSQTDTHFFLLLHQFTRAGSPSLQSYFKSQIKELRLKRQEIKSRIKTDSELKKEDQATYYSSWAYAAVHILTSIPEFQTLEAISKKLNLSEYMTRDILEFLTQNGIIQKEGTRYTIGKVRIHLEKSNPLISKHHLNFRIKSIQSFELSADQNPLHYSSVVSLAREDIEKIKSILLSAIEKSEALIRKSPEEELMMISLDCFHF